MAEGKGHTELPWRIKTTGNIGNAIEGHAGMPSRYEGDDGFRTVCMVQSCCPSDSLADDERKNFEANRSLIVTAVNTYPAIEGLVKALEDSRILAVRCCDEPLMAEIDSALSRFRSLQNGGAN
jgi:hypothetical protein